MAQTTGQTLVPIIIKVQTLATINKRGYNIWRINDETGWHTDHPNIVETIIKDFQRIFTKDNNISRSRFSMLRDIE